MGEFSSGASRARPSIMAESFWFWGARLAKHKGGSAVQHMLMTFLLAVIWHGIFLIFFSRAAGFSFLLSFCFAYVSIIYIYRGFQHLFFFCEVAFVVVRVK
jgi:hypothetical protein